MEGQDVLVWGRFVNEQLNVYLTDRSRLAGVIIYLLGRPPLDPSGPRGSEFEMPIAGDDGHFTGSWDCPMTVAELDDILSDVIRIADGEVPATAQADWAAHLAGIVNYWRGVLVESTPTCFDGTIAVPYEGAWACPVKWGEFAQLIKAFASGGKVESNPQHQWGEHLVAVVKALQPSAEVLHVEVPDEPAAEPSPTTIVLDLSLWGKLCAKVRNAGRKVATLLRGD